LTAFDLVTSVPTSQGVEETRPEEWPPDGIRRSVLLESAAIGVGYPEIAPVPLLENPAARGAFAAALMLFGSLAIPLAAHAQDEGPPAPADTAAVDPSSEILTNNIAGEFTPSQGFSLVRTSKGSLNISGYALFR
jgi:hypothetical protein